MSSLPSRPQNISYGDIVEVPNTSSTPGSPQYCPSSPFENYHTGNTPVSPEYSASSPVYISSPPVNIPHSPREERNTRPKKTTITDTVHIPRWATSFVLGGRDMKHIINIFRRHGSIVDIVGINNYEELNCIPITVVTLISIGTKDIAIEAMQNVKRDLISTINKAKQMKRDRTWGAELRRQEYRRHRENDRRRLCEDARRRQRGDDRRRQREDRSYYGY